MLIAWGVFLAALALYLGTLASGLPWGDAGELIAAAILAGLVAGTMYLAPLFSAGFEISRNAPAYYLPVYFVTAPWLGLGLQWLLARVAAAATPASRAAAWRPALAGGLVLVALPALIGLRGFQAAESRRTDVPARLARFLLAEAQPRAVLVAQEDDCLFPLLYAQQVGGLRQDVTVVSAPWHGRFPRYPDLVIPQGPEAGSVEALLLANAGRRPLYVVGSIEGLGAAEIRFVPRGVLFELRDAAPDPAAHRGARARFEAAVLGRPAASLDPGTAAFVSRVYGALSRDAARRGWLEEALRLTGRRASS